MGHLLHRLPACLRAGQVSGMVLTAPKVQLSEMPRLITSTARGPHKGHPERRSSVDGQSRAIPAYGSTCDAAIHSGYVIRSSEEDVP
jgi:hypothetical protein